MGASDTVGMGELRDAASLLRAVAGRHKIRGRQIHDGRQAVPAARIPGRAARAAAEGWNACGTASARAGTAAAGRRRPADAEPDGLPRSVPLRALWHTPLASGGWRWPLYPLWRRPS